MNAENKSPKVTRARLNYWVMTCLKAAVAAVFSLVVLVLCASTGLDAAPQQPTDVPAVSLDRIREGLAKPPALKLDVKSQLPVAIFRAGVEQRVYVLTFEEQLHKDFDLNVLQRQSADWASKCCGVDVGQVLKGIDRARQRQQARKIRDQVARELAQVEAARRTQLPQ
jgi:hypothetical protein